MELFYMGIWHYTKKMDPKFWLERWEKKEIGFHKTEVNPGLLLVQKSFHLQPNQTVLVPLCGKSLDLLWFAHQGMRVVGVELSAIACEEFFSENQINFEKKKLGDFQIYRSSQIEIWCGDFFQVPLSGPFDLIYDRASNIALPPQMRKSYYALVQRFLGPKTLLCLIAIEYEQSLLEGPPFSVSEEEVRKAYSGFEVKKLSDKELFMDNKRFEEAGVKTREKIYGISRRSE